MRQIAIFTTPTNTQSNAFRRHLAFLLRWLIGFVANIRTPGLQILPRRNAGLFFEKAAEIRGILKSEQIPGLADIIQPGGKKRLRTFELSEIAVGKRRHSRILCKYTSEKARTHSAQHRNPVNAQALLRVVIEIVDAGLDPSENDIFQFIARLLMMTADSNAKNADFTFVVRGRGRLFSSNTLENAASSLPA